MRDGELRGHRSDYTRGEADDILSSSEKSDSQASQ